MPINVCQSLFSLFFTIFSKNLAKSLQEKEIKFSCFFCFVTLCDSSLNKSLYYIHLLFSSLKLCLLNHQAHMIFCSLHLGLGSSADDASWVLPLPGCSFLFCKFFKFGDGSPIAQPPHPHFSVSARP